MKSKRKLLISVLVILFVLIAVISTIAIIFAATQQSITTNLNINYTAEDINATVSAKMVYQDGTSEELGSLTFEAGSATETGSLSPSGDMELTKNNKYVVFEYTFQNTGDKDFVAMFDYTDTDTIDSNMAFSYKEAGDYRENANAVLVEGGETKTYYVKIEVDNLAKNAHLSGDVLWDLRSDIIVATPDTAQEVLNNDINGKIVVFDEGEYSEILNLRATANTVSSIKYYLDVEATMPEETIGDEITGEPVVGEKYHYFREVTDVVFAGSENAILKNKFSIKNGDVSNGVGDHIDAVRNIVYTKLSDGYHVENLTITDIEFTGLNFEGIDGRIYSYLDAKSTGTIDGITIKNCSFKTQEVVSSAALQIYSDLNQKCVNIEFKNNYIDGHYQGLHIENGENILIENNIIKNTTHNAFAIQSRNSGSNDTSYYFKGEITIRGNKISNTSDRAIRFGLGNGATITIEGNTFVNCTDSGSLLKTQKPATDCTYSFTNNTYGGIKLANTSGTITSTTQWEVTV